jgi:hypothetical protein
MESMRPLYGAAQSMLKAVMMTMRNSSQTYISSNGPHIGLVGSRTAAGETDAEKAITLGMRKAANDQLRRQC